MANQTVSFRLPAKAIKQIASKTGKICQSKTAVIVKALTQALSLPQTSLDLTINSLQHQLESLQNQVVSLSTQLTELSQVGYSDNSFLPLTMEPRQMAAVDAAKEEEFRIKAQQVGETQPLGIQNTQPSKMLDQILALSPDPLITYDRLGRFTYANAAAAQLLGCQPNYLLGKTCQEINLSSALAARLSAQQEVVLMTGQPVYDDICLPTANGVRTYECILNPIWTEDTQIDTVICTARDITEHKQAEAALRESEERYRNLFELADDAIFIIDVATHQFLNVNQNAARRLGFTRQELLQLSIDYIIAPQESASMEARLQELQGKGGVVFEQVFHCKDGATMLVEISAHVIEYDTRLAFQWFVRNICDRSRDLRSEIDRSPANVPGLGNASPLSPPV